MTLPEVDEVRVTTMVDNTFDALLVSALVTVQSGNASSTLLFDTGASPDGLAVNAERLGIDVGGLQGVVLSHGHFDHAGGFDGLARLRGRSGLPLTVHPAVWTRRRLELPPGRVWRCPPCYGVPWNAKGSR
ncbi:MBL fold metallo-hydrolase [Streptomyces lydicus]|uniref:MBL fold metallo-hydrolase n=1 Tax=Streptomyces lydicus TaxID=47763 RepID=UPI003799E4A1